MRPSNRRRQFFIKKEFQGKFVLIYAVGVLALAGSATLLFERFARQTIDRHLYSSHIKVASSGDLIKGLLFQVNLVSAAAVILLVTLLSLYIFYRLNHHFGAMEERFIAMARGNFTLPAQEGSRFSEISALIELAEAVRGDYRRRYEDLTQTLDEIEALLDSEQPREGLRSAEGRLSAILAQTAVQQ